MKLREHLENLHKRLAEHHIARAKFHKAMGAHLRKLDGDEYGDMAAEHDGMDAEHANLADFHVECCKTFGSMGKATGMADFDELVPMAGISAIHEAVPSNLRPIARYGGRELLTHKVDAGDPASAVLAALAKVED
jgi:hypothetical protein